MEIHQLGAVHNQNKKLLTVAGIFASLAILYYIYKKNKR